MGLDEVVECGKARVVRHEALLAAPRDPSRSTDRSPFPVDLAFDRFRRHPWDRLVNGLVIQVVSTELAVRFLRDGTELATFVAWQQSEGLFPDGPYSPVVPLSPGGAGCSISFVRGGVPRLRPQCGRSS